MDFLPPDWERVRLGDLFEIQQGKALSPKARAGINPKPFLRTANVFWGRLDLGTVDEMDFSDEEAAKLALRPGDLLVCEGGDIGRTAIWQGELPLCCCQNHVHRLRARDTGVEPQFVMLWMEAAIRLLGLYGGQGNKTTIPNLSKSRLAAFEVPLPPLAEQRAIAEVLLVVQRTKDATEKVIAALRELKMSLLKHLFTYGPVPFNQADKVPLKETEVGAIPEGWNVARLGDISDWMRYGTSRRCHPQPQGLPVLRIPNVINSSINTADLKFVEMDKKEADRYRLQVRDLLFVRTNGQREYVGRCAVYEGEPEHCLFASYLIGVRVRPDEVLADYIRLYALTPAGRRFLSGRASGAADGKFNINTQTLRSVMLPVPPIEMQRRIVHAVDAADAGMAAAGQRFTALEATFKLLLGQLMTGKVRLPGFGTPSASAGG